MFNTVRKIFRQFTRPSLLFSSIPEYIFPNEGIPSLKISARLYSVKNELLNRKLHNNLGSLYTIPHPLAVKTYSSFLKYNPNHLGNWSIKETGFASYQLEYEVIKKMINLYKADKEKLEGYISSGGTESNIFLTWMGRSYLQQYYKIDKICLVSSNLTHYSVKKASKICAIEQYYCPIDNTYYSMHPESFEKMITDLYLKGKKGFLIPLTIGYTQTGTSDDINLILNIVNKLLKQYKDLRFFIWIDAAMNGLIEPFVNPNFKPFYSPLVNAIVVDFHKYGHIPYSAGLILYREKFRKYIEQTIEYLAVDDNTLLGSRTGVASVSIWTIIHTLGINGYTTILKEQFLKKEYFISQIKKIVPSAEIITARNSLTCGIIFNSFKNQLLPKYIEEKYWLYPSKTTLIFQNSKKSSPVIYKFFFLPHVLNKSIKYFAQDLEKIK